ncbi:hypothetical protein H0H87_001357, partial [Tephrocybe sp. NHM501043]
GCTTSAAPSSHLSAQDKADTQHKMQESTISTNAFWGEEFDRFFDKDVGESFFVHGPSDIQFSPDCFDIQEPGPIVGSEFELTDRLFQDALSDSSSDHDNGFFSDIDADIPPNALPASAAETVTQAPVLLVGTGSTGLIGIELGAPIATPTVMRLCPSQAMPSVTYQNVEQNYTDSVVPIPMHTPQLPSPNTIQHYPGRSSFYATAAYMPPPSNPGPTGRVDAYMHATSGVHQNHHMADTHLLALPQGYLLQDHNNTHTHTFWGYTSSRQDTGNSINHHHSLPSMSVLSAHNLPAAMSGVTADATVQDVQLVTANPEPLNGASSDNGHYLPPTRRELYFAKKGVYCFTKFTCAWGTCDEEISLDAHDSDAATNKASTDIYLPMLKRNWRLLGSARSRTAGFLLRRITEVSCDMSSVSLAPSSTFAMNVTINGLATRT